MDHIGNLSLMPSYLLVKGVSIERQGRKKEEKGSRPHSEERENIFS